MKKIILAFDSFKGSANSLDIARAAKEAILKECPLCNVTTFPIADGGEGTTEAICTGLNVDKVSCSVHDPLMAPIDVTYGITKDGTTAVLEMAAASGLPLVPDRLRNPMNTSTYGTGEVILDALNKGCRHFIMGLGGSATNDAAIGMLSALGVRFLDNSGNILEPKGRNLIHITSLSSGNKRIFFYPRLRCEQSVLRSTGRSICICSAKRSFSGRSSSFRQRITALCCYYQKTERNGYFFYSRGRSCRWHGRRLVTFPSSYSKAGY